jgi:hypothetical protein
MPSKKYSSRDTIPLKDAKRRVFANSVPPSGESLFNDSAAPRTEVYFRNKILETVLFYNIQYADPQPCISFKKTKS